MKLIEVLSKVPRDKIVIIGVAGEISAGELIGRAQRYADIFDGRRIAVRLSDAIEGIEALVAADGRATSLALLSATLSERHLKHLLGLSKNELLIEDGQTSDLVCEDTKRRIRNESALHQMFNETDWHLATSGSAGTPKLVGHTIKTLTRSVKRPHPSGPTARWGLLYDFTRFAGLQVILQSIYGGGELIIPPSTYSLSERIAMFIESGCTHLSATPTLWRHILMVRGATSLPLQQITLGGEIADQRILSSLREAFPEARITHIFASTETGVGFSVTDEKAGFPVSYLRSHPAGVSLRVVDGRLQIKSAGVEAYYVGTNDLLSMDDRWIDTGDCVEQVGDRVIFIGRENGVINIGGNKVFPEEVESHLLSHPAVVSARVFSKSSALLGSLVAADIVVAKTLDDPPRFRKDLQQSLQTQLERYKVPVIINFVDQIEAAQTGKLSRISAE